MPQVSIVISIRHCDANGYGNLHAGANNRYVDYFLRIQLVNIRCQRVIRVIIWSTYRSPQIIDTIVPNDRE